jgi:predicted Rossmann fold nucleotide-binding protein DprA/Smf involved in DNA uptake
MLALFCSSQTPPSLLLAVHDLAQQWRQSGPVIVGGFQSQVEDEALTVLLRGPQPVIVWLARGLYRQTPPRFKPALAANRLLFVSPFADHVRRATEETAQTRNRLCAAAAQAVLIAHAQPGSKTAALAHETLSGGKLLYTLDHPANRNLLDLSAQVYVY